MVNKMRGLFAVVVAVMGAGRGVWGEAGVSGVAGPTPEQAIYKLADGHARYLMGAATNPRRNEKRRVEVAAGQHPFAAVLSCADSRVPVEVLFDQGLGDIFTVRVAGNVADISEMASLEYGVEHLHIPVLVVLGHTKCGAVSAAIGGGEMPPHIGHLLGLVAPAVAEGKKEQPNLSGNDRVTDVVKRNVVMTMGVLLKESEIVREAVETRKLKLVGAIYDLDDGKVRFLGEHAEQAGIIAAAKGAPEGKAEHAATASAAPAGAHGAETPVAVVDKVANDAHKAMATHEAPKPTSEAPKLAHEAPTPAQVAPKPAHGPAPTAPGHGVTADAASGHR